MPSPFPGMDPFLEHPALFPGLHNRLIVRLSEVLQTALPEPYFAEIGERIWVEVSERDIEPDVNVLRGAGPGRHEETATATATRNQPVVVTVPVNEHRETWVEIRTRHGQEERVVTSIEILSRSNKAPGRRGRDLYLLKQRELLDSPTHLVEIDLLRGGTHTTAVPLDRLRTQVGPFDYHVSIHRFDQNRRFLGLSDPPRRAAAGGGLSPPSGRSRRADRSASHLRSRLRHRPVPPPPPLRREHRDSASLRRSNGLGGGASGTGRTCSVSSRGKLKGCTKRSCRVGFRLPRP